MRTSDNYNSRTDSDILPSNNGIGTLNSDIGRESHVYNGGGGSRWGLSSSQCTGSINDSFYRHTTKKCMNIVISGIKAQSKYK